MLADINPEVYVSSASWNGVQRFRIPLNVIQCHQYSQKSINPLVAMANDECTRAVINLLFIKTWEQSYFGDRLILCKITRK